MKHPAGVDLPFDGPSDAALIIPEIRSEIRSGAYDADVIALLDGAVRAGDRVLVIGAGLGIVSTLIARRTEVDRVIAVEANTALIPYLERTHALNGVSRVETVNAVLAEGKKGRVPFFARRDLRNSSLLPHDRSWQQVMMVPFMDLNLIVAEERITLVVSEIPASSAGLLARAELGPVERILLSYADDPSGAWDDDGVCARLIERGFVPEPAGTAVLLRRADLLKEAPGEAGARAEAPVQPQTEETAPEADEDTDDDDDHEDAEGGPVAEAAEPADPVPADPGPALPQPPRAARETRPPQEHAAEPERHPEASAAAAPPPPDAAREPRERQGARGAARAAGGTGATPDAARPEAGRAGIGRRQGIWGLVAVTLFLALPLMLIGQLAGERGGARTAAVEQLGAAWGGPQTLTGPFLLVPVLGPGGEPAQPLVILPGTLEVTTALGTDAGRDGAAGDGYGALVYRSRSEIRLDAEPEAAAALLAPGETALWEESRLGLGISEPSALGAAYLLGGEAGESGFAAGSGAEDLPGIHAPLGDPRAGASAWRFVIELDGWRDLRLTPSGGTTTWRVHGDWPHPGFRGPFRPELAETGENGFVVQWRVPEAAIALPRAFRGAGPLVGLSAMAVGVELAQPLDLYRTIERGAKLGLVVIVLTFGAMLLLERSAGRSGHVVHYALIGAAQCAFFLLLLPLAERLGFAPAYAVAAAATTALLTAYAWSALGLGPRAGWVTLALAALYGVIYPILTARGDTLLMGAVLVFLIVAALMWATRGEGRGQRQRERPAEGHDVGGADS